MKKEKGDKPAPATALTDLDQSKHWLRIEQRVMSQLAELEEKHAMLRAGLNTEEATVLMFVNDLIKRIDLIESMRQKYLREGAEEVAEQFYLLRASLEDILMQHGVVEFSVEPGSLIDEHMRQCITVVGSIPGKKPPTVTESLRPGFLQIRENGKERVIRKVEVKTSSQ